MRVQYASDLHLEIIPFQAFHTILTPSASILLLAGNICPVEQPLYSHFLQWCSKWWTHVLVVAGNREYFRENVIRTISEVDAEIRRITYQLPNVIFLQDGDSILIDGFRFVGTTLWSKVDTGLWAMPLLLQKEDYTHTQMSPGRKTEPADILNLHLQQKKELELTIARSREPVIVITHHLPTVHLVRDSHKKSPLLSMYVSNVENAMTSKVRYWICGHSHTSKQWVAPSETVCTMNPRGYGGSNPHFYKSAVIELSC